MVDDQHGLQKQVHVAARVSVVGLLQRCMQGLALSMVHRLLSLQAKNGKRQPICCTHDVTWPGARGIEGPGARTPAPFPLTIGGTAKSAEAVL